ncbi:hypothetical protein QPR65_22370 (plasmid) [Enterobacter hormaechei]|uniref:hypothetical protein n=1 Tax=Enterobacter hormaechei TaxID=158836 RepID=UPI0027D295B8|nr:hypothetical protein [Enterobacter hormaechei]WLZ51987.1 hypothetical protein QPR65_22370 [Enterobacter hormaechei]
MAEFKELIISFAVRITSHSNPESRKQELDKIFDEINVMTYGISQPIRDEVIKRIYRDLKKELLQRGFSQGILGLEKRGGFEWYTESNSVGNEEAIELMRMVARGMGK